MLPVSFLVLSVVFSTTFALFYKIAAHKDANLQKVNLWMYVGSAATALAYAVVSGRLAFNFDALLLGIISGVALFFATLTFFYHMRTGQLSVSWTIISLTLAFPVLASIFVWNEHPSARQIAGLVLIVVALVLFGRQDTGDREDAP